VSRRSFSISRRDNAKPSGKRARRLAQLVRSPERTASGNTRLRQLWLQRLTGLSYLHPQSDIDLLLVVGTLAQADAATRLLLGAPFDVPRIDGELVFSDGAANPLARMGSMACAARGRVLVKRRQSVALEDPRSWVTA